MAAADDKVQVLFVNTATRPPLGADTWVHLQIMRALDRDHHSLVAACNPGSASAPTPTAAAAREIPDLEIVPVNFGPEIHEPTTPQKLHGLVATLPVFAGIARLALLIRRRRIRIVHTSDRPRDAAVCVLLARLTNAQCLIHVHVAWGEWMSPMLRKALRRADGLIAISEFVKDSLVASGHDPARIHVVLNGSDTAALTPGEGRADARAEFGLASHAPVIISVCRLFAEKGPALLIEAMTTVHRHHPDAHLWIVGGEMTTGYAADLAALAERLGIADRVTLTGRRNDVARLMAGADIFAMPSFEEPFGLVFTEAMAMQLPVVALRSGGAPEIIEHERTGLLSEPGDVPSIADHLLRLIADPEMRQDMGQRGRDVVLERFTIQRMAADMAATYALIASQ